MKDIKGYEGRYAVTSCGRVWSFLSNRWLVLHKTQLGYYEALLSDGNKRKHFGIHRLVLGTYNPVEGMEHLDAAHKDDDKSHNYLNNLHWTTHKENCNEGSRNKKIADSMIGNNRGYRRVG